MENLILIPIPVDQLKSDISDIVKKEMQTLISLLQQSENKSTEYLTRKETASILCVSLPTLNEWTKTGLVKGYRIASRIRYKRAEIETSLAQVRTTYKR